MGTLIGIIAVIYLIESVVSKITASKVIPYAIGIVLYIVFIRRFSRVIKNTFALYRQTREEIDHLTLEQAQPVSNEYRPLPNAEIVRLANMKSASHLPTKCDSCGAPFIYDRKTFSPNCQYCGSVIKINAAVLRELNRLRQQEEDKETAWKHELDKKQAISTLLNSKKNYLITTRLRIALYLSLSVLLLIGIFIVVPAI